MTDNHPQSKLPPEELSSLKLSLEVAMLSVYEERLALIAHDELAGIDIAQKYPQFFADKGKSLRLQAAYTDVLELLQTPLPDIEVPAAQLSFLASRYGAEDRPFWSLSTVDVRNCFPDGVSYPALLHTLREEPAADAVAVATLLRTSFQCKAHTLDVCLQLLTDVQDTFTFRPYVAVRVQDGEGDFKGYEVALDWGAYSAAVCICPKGVVVLPPLAGELIFDQENEPTTGLVFAIQPI